MYTILEALSSLSIQKKVCKYFFNPYGAILF